MSYKPENQSHFYIGVDGDEPEIQEVEEIYISDDEPMVRRLGEENEDVAIIIDSGADVALFPLSVAGHGEGELQFSTKTKLQDAQGNRIPTGGAKSVEISLRDLDGREVLLKENAIFSSKVNQPIPCYTWLGNQQHDSACWRMVTCRYHSTCKIALWQFKAALESFKIKMGTAWKRKYLKLLRKNQVDGSMNMDC